MEIAKVQVSGCRCEVTCLEPIPKGIVGGMVSIEYTDGVWDNLQKTVVFRGAVTKDVLNAGKEVVIPAEVVARAGVQLYMGLYGVNADGAVVIPTIWASLGIVRGAAAPSGDSSTDPSLPVWAQLQAMIGDLDKLDTTVKDNLVAAVNEALLSGGGTVSPGAIQKIVEDYLKANPACIGVDGKDGTDGKDGITPTIGSNGNWYLGETDTGKPSRGAKGDTGSTGPKGADGVTPNIQIGTVTTLPAGSDATASMGGTTENPLLNLGIPKGADGQGGGSGGLQWHLVADMELEEQTNSISVTQDSDGSAFSAYNPVAMLCTIGIPADSTQTSTNGNVWMTPKPSTDVLSRAILSVAGWKTTARILTELFIGSDSSFLGTGFVAAANGDVFGAPAGYLSGINVYVNGAGDHLPVGTKLRVMLLSGGKQ